MVATGGRHRGEARRCRVGSGQITDTTSPPDKARSPLGLMVDAVRQGREGLVVALRDSAGLAEAVRSLWEDPERRAEMGRAGRARVISHFNLDDQAEAVLALYREVAGR